MKTSLLSLLSAYTAVFFLVAVFTDFSVDAAAELTAATAGKNAHSQSILAKSNTFLSKLNPRAIYPTAIGRDDAVTHPEKTETGGSLHGIVGQVERNLASRRLLINQDEAAKRVQDAVTTANQAVENGETSGVALPLDYVFFNEQVGAGRNQFLTVRLRLPGVDKDQNVMIDTGSGSLAFCDKSLIDEAKNIIKTKYAQCNEYGSDFTCPDGSTGKFLGYASQIYRGDVGAYNDQGEEVASMDNVSFTIMDFEQMGNSCFGPLDGIIGVAYKDLYKVVELPSPDFNISSLWNVSCPNPDQVKFSQGYETLGHCDIGNMTYTRLNPPLQQALEQDYNSGQITAEAFGLYLDYAATIGSKVGTIVPSLGIYFGGDLAYDNQFYNDGKVQVAKALYCDGLMEWYDLNFTSIRLPGFNFTQSTVDLCSECPRCYTDTGNGYIELPLPQELCNNIVESPVDELKKLGSLFIDLTAADGKDITLSFPLLWLVEQIALGHVVCTGTTGDFVLGLPITQYYYTVYDMGNKTVSFVELNLSNETEAFIDGPELGGAADDDDGTTTISPTPQPTNFSVGAAAELSAATGGDRSAHSPSLLAKSNTFLSKLNPRAIYHTEVERDDAVTHPETGGSLYGIAGQVERNLASRRLLINQDDAAKKVQDAVTTANQAVDNGETSGVALPLDYVQLSEQFGGTQQLTVRLRLPGVDRDLNVVIDTGSSDLAFCDKSLIEETENISKTNYAQCESYSSELTCPDGSKGHVIGMAGQVFRGDVGAYNDQGEEVASMDNVTFTIMDFSQIYTCFGPLVGIIGVAYKGMNSAVELPSPDFDVSSLWNKKCVNPDQVLYSQGYKALGNCGTGNMTQVNLNPPLQQALQQDYNSGQITSEAFGLYLDYAATIGSKVDTIVPSLGIFFGGNLAYDNHFYNNGKVQVAETLNCGGVMVWYQLNFTSIRVPGFNLTQSTVDLCSECDKCYTDTGTSYIALPLPQEFCNDLANTESSSIDELVDELVDELKKLGSLFIDLTAADGNDDITLAFPLLWLREQLGLGHVKCTGTAGDFILGLPITQYYYTVNDMGKNTVSFVELNLSNETEAFIDGPELGGAASKGCFCHTFGLSLLAWTVLVPVVAMAYSL